MGIINGLQYSFTRRMASSGMECEEKVRVEVEDANDNTPVFEKVP